MKAPHTLLDWLMVGIGCMSLGALVGTAMYGGLLMVRFVFGMFRFVVSGKETAIKSRKIIERAK